MALINDCSPEEALWVYHNDALAVLEQTFQQQMDALTPMLADVDAAVADIADTISKTFGEDPESACTLPTKPTKSEIEALVSTPSLSVVNGRIVLPGTLSLAALRRLYGIFGSLASVARYIPEFSMEPVDPNFGKTGLQTRFLLVELRLQVTETATDACAPGDITVTEREVLVRVNSHVSEEADDRILVFVWIGEPELTDGLRQQMVALGLTDDEIIAATLSQSTPGFEVYGISDPNRLWKYAQTFTSSSEDSDGLDHVNVLLDRPIDAVNDAPTAAELGTALRNAMTTPTVTGCGFPVALGLLSTMDVNSLLPTLGADCDTNPNVFGPVNEIFGAMGSIQRTIDRVLSSYQDRVGRSMAGLVSIVTDVERKYLGRGLASASVTGPSGTFTAAANYMGSSRSAYSSARSYAQDTFRATGPTNRFQSHLNSGQSTSPLIPTVPQPPDVDISKVQDIVNKLSHYMQLFTDSVNAVTQIVTGMSLLMCSLSWTGNTLSKHHPNIAGLDHVFKYARPKCADATLSANIDLSSINFDLINVAISMLRDLIHRLVSLLNSLIRAQNSSNALIQLNCTVTETAQLAIDISRRLAAQNWGQF